MISLNDLKRMVDDTIEKCNGMPISEFPIRMNGRPVDIEISVAHTQGTSVPIITIYESDED
jgi:hypothetical protein